MIDPVARSDAFDASLANSPTHIHLVRIVEQHKMILRWLTLSLVLILVLFGLVAWLAVQARQSASTANSAVTQGHVGCAAANELRATERQLWGFILTLPPPPDETARARAEREKETKLFKSYVAQKLANRDCDGHATPALRHIGHHSAAAPSPVIIVRTSVVHTSPTPSPTRSSESPRPTPQPDPRPTSSSPSPSPSSSRICVDDLICFPPGGTLIPHLSLSWRLV